MMEGGTVVDARAPGKVILSGEHAVVHGTSAVAAAIGLYTTASIRLRPLSAGSYPGIWIYVSLGLQALSMQTEGDSSIRCKGSYEVGAALLLVLG